MRCNVRLFLAMLDSANYLNFVVKQQSLPHLCDHLAGWRAGMQAHRKADTARVVRALTAARLANANEGSMEDAEKFVSCLLLLPSPDA